MEDGWMRCEREYFVTTVGTKYKVPAKDLNSILTEYNKFLQKALLGESPFVAEDLLITILKGGKSDTERKDTGSGRTIKEGSAIS